MSRAYFVRRWYLWSDGEVRCSSFDYDSYESALEHFNRFAAMDGTTRVALNKRGPKGRSSTLKVGTSPL